MIRFTVLEDFFSEETESQYVAGLSYQAWPEDKLLLELIPQWIEDRLITFGGPEATITGRE